MAKDSSLSPPAIFIITPLVVYVKQKNTKYNKKITEGSLGDGESEAIAAGQVMPEHPIASTKAGQSSP